MKKIFLVVIAVFITTSVMAEVKQPEMKSYVGLGFTTVSVSGEFNSKKTSDSGAGAFVNGGVKLNKNSRVNIYSYAINVDSAGVPFFKVSQLGISYDHKFGNREKQGLFIGGGIAKTTTKVDTTVSGNKVTSSASSTGLLLRLGYEYVINKDLLLITAANFDLSKQKTKLKTNGIERDDLETSIGFNGEVVMEF